MKGETAFGGEVVWYPSSEYTDHAHLTQFIQYHNLPDFEALMVKSTQDVPWFTEAVLKYLDIKFYKPYSQVMDLSQGAAWPKWVLGGKMNIVHNLLDKHIGRDKENQIAFVAEDENNEFKSYTYRELWLRVNQAANALRGLGIKPGDAIGLYMPMTPEIVVAMLAIAKIGAIILPLFSGYGAGALSTRLADTEAKALFTADGFQRRGRMIAMKPVADKAVAQVPSLKHVIVLNNANLDVEMIDGRDHWWHHLVDTQSEEAATEMTDAEQVLMVIYTSGTTGRPKGAVHTHTGFPIKAAQDMAFGTDVHPGQRVYWMTDMGWMMGPWLVFGSLILGSTFILYDGSPDFPGPNRIWDLVERHHITTLGISPTLIRSLIPYGKEPIRSHDISSLKFFASTGEPWNPDPWMWLFDQVGQRQRPIINYSGGTEISGGIVMGNPLMPLKPTAFSAPCPGIAADVLNERGQPVRNEVGELVIKKPWIGMTRGFWRDPERYEETFWSRWPGVWVHGDFAAIDSDGQWYILGRSDDTIKVAGKRLGPAEVESILVSHPDVIEAAAVGVPDELKGNALVVFCVLGARIKPIEILEKELTDLIISALGKPLAPRQLFFVTDLPKTRNAKVMRRMIRAAFLGQDPGDTTSLLNPESITEIQKVK